MIKIKFKKYKKNYFDIFIKKNFIKISTWKLIFVILAEAMFMQYMEWCGSVVICVF